MTKKTQRILTLIFVLFACFTSLASILVCIYNEFIFTNFNPLLKDLSLALWLGSCFLTSILVKKQSKKAIFFASILLSAIFTLQMLFVFNAYNYIEIQHYFDWGYSITLREVISRDVFYDFAYGTFKYVTVFTWMFGLCILGAVLQSNLVKNLAISIKNKVLLKDLYDDFDDDFAFFGEMPRTTDAAKVKKEPSRGKLNSRARAARRKLKKKQ